MKNRALLLLTLILLIALLAGCTGSKFDTSYKQFKESYILATDFLNYDKDQYKCFQNMNVEVVKTQLKNMKQSMDIMSTELNTKDDKLIYETNIKNYYQGLQFLVYANKNYDKLSINEKRKMYIELDLATLNRESIKKGEI